MEFNVGTKGYMVPSIPFSPLDNDDNSLNNNFGSNIGAIGLTQKYLWVKTPDGWKGVKLYE